MFATKIAQTGIATGLDLIRGCSLRDRDIKAVAASRATSIFAVTGRFTGVRMSFVKTKKEKWHGQI